MFWQRIAPLNSAVMSVTRFCPGGGLSEATLNLFPLLMRREFDRDRLRAAALHLIEGFIELSVLEGRFKGTCSRSKRHRRYLKIEPGSAPGFKSPCKQALKARFNLR